MLLSACSPGRALAGAAVSPFFFTLHLITENLETMCSRGLSLAPFHATAIQLDSGVSVLQRRITELEQALDRCQKRLEIPTVALVAHPEVEAASVKVGKGRKVDLDAVGLGRRVKEDAFLNQVQV